MEALIVILRGLRGPLDASRQSQVDLAVHAQIEL